jgi:flagellar biosynthesis/type III secretory pathway chaperone
MSTHPDALATLLKTLIAEEETLGRLVALALEEQHALMMSDRQAIERISANMHTVADGMDDLERQREALMSAIDATGATLADLVPLAEEHHIEGFDAARAALLQRVAELKEAQERNARLILGAVRLQERWMNVIGGLEPASTYGSAGRQDPGHRRGFVSKSA